MQTNPSAHFIGRRSDLRIAVSSEIDELGVRSDRPNLSVLPLAQPIEASFASRT